MYERNYEKVHIMTGPASEEPLMSIDIEGYVRKVA